MCQLGCFDRWQLILAQTCNAQKWPDNQKHQTAINLGKAAGPKSGQSPQKHQQTTNSSLLLPKAARPKSGQTSNNQNCSLLLFKAAGPKSGQTFKNVKQQFLSAQSCRLRKEPDPQQRRTAANFGLKLQSPRVARQPPGKPHNAKHHPILGPQLSQNAAPGSRQTPNTRQPPNAIHQAAAKRQTPSNSWPSAEPKCGTRQPPNAKHHPILGPQLSQNVAPGSRQTPNTTQFLALS